MSAALPLDPYRVVAFNTAHDSENKIHDDATARRFGFGGGLVPGVDVYGYMTHLPVMRWGRAWLEHGIAECRFFKPVYDGDTATVTATEATARWRSRSKAAASSAQPAAPRCRTRRRRRRYRRIPPGAAARERPPADEASLPVDGWLGLDPYPITPEMAARYLADSHESAPIYAEQGLVHPRDILRSCNFVISRNVRAGTMDPYRQPHPASAGGAGRECAVGARPRYRQL